jgi:hypothetical protein
MPEAEIGARVEEQGNDVSLANLSKTDLAILSPPGLPWPTYIIGHNLDMVK